MVRVLLEHGTDINAKEDTMAKRYKQHHTLVTTRWYRYSSSVEEMSMLKEETIAMRYKQHHSLVTRRWCRYSLSAERAQIRKLTMVGCRCWWLQRMGMKLW